MSFLVKNYMNKSVRTVDMEASVAEASRIMMERRIGYLIALENTRPVGIVTGCDLVVRVMARERDPSKIRVSEVMSTPLVVLDPDTTVEDAARTMAKHGKRRLPVVRGDRLYGVFSAWDLAKHFNEYEDRVARDIVGSMPLFLQDDISIS